jgi:hypothetical protein
MRAHMHLHWLLRVRGMKRTHSRKSPHTLAVVVKSCWQTHCRRTCSLSRNVFSFQKCVLFMLGGIKRTHSRKRTYSTLTYVHLIQSRPIDLFFLFFASDSHLRTLHSKQATRARGQTDLIAKKKSLKSQKPIMWPNWPHRKKEKSQKSET